MVSRVVSQRLARRLGGKQGTIVAAPRHYVLYGINTHVWLTEVSRCLFTKTSTATTAPAYFKTVLAAEPAPRGCHSPPYPRSSSSQASGAPQSDLAGGGAHLSLGTTTGLSGCISKCGDMICTPCSLNASWMFAFRADSTLIRWCGSSR